VACSGHPTREERALVSGIEKEVVLPKGGGRLGCYERHYLLLKGEQANSAAGFAVPGGRLLIGEYLHGPKAKPGVYWANDAKQMPAIADTGCDVLELWYVPGEGGGPVHPWCSPNIAGNQPEVIEPAVTC
jgi:hypothetical protein